MRVVPRMPATCLERMDLGVSLNVTILMASGMPGTSRYITTKNRKNTPERLEIKKYNPILKKYTVHKEIK